MKKYTQIIFILLGLILMVPSTASAAVVYLQAANTNISVGDTVVVTVKVNAEGKTLNTVDGDVALKTGGSGLAVKEFSLANSAFGLWPRTPSLSKDGQVVSFVGGVPGGFNIEGATLFKIIFEAKKAGAVTISPQNIAVFANDGKGTKLPVKSKGLVINVAAKKTGVASNDEWQAVVAADTKPPEDFIVVLGQDPNLFDGKKFAFFSAIDNQSGIDHYEVVENGAKAVRSGSTYVLQNQTVDPELSVVAFDKAGNKKMTTYPNKAPQPISWSFIIGVVVLVIVLRVIYRILRRNKKNASARL